MWVCRAQDQLAKMREMKDNNIFKDLGSLLAPDLDLPSASALAKSLVQVRCLVISL